MIVDFLLDTGPQRFTGTGGLTRPEQKLLFRRAFSRK